MSALTAVCLPCAIGQAARRPVLTSSPPPRQRFVRIANITCKASPPAVDKEEAQIDAEWAKEVLEEVVNPPPGELGQRGELWLAGQLLALVAVVIPPNGLRAFVDAGGWLTFAAGLALVVAGQQRLGKNLTPLPKPRDDSALVTTGAYAYCRHPMYGGLILASLGLSVALGDELRLAIALLLAVILDRKAAYEEELLKARYGKEYEAYQETTKKLIPKIY